MKKNKLLLAIATLLAAGLATAHAQTPTTSTSETAPAPAEATTGSWTLTPAFVTQYMFRGVRLGGPSLEPSLEFDYGALAVGVWNNTPLADKVPGQSDPEFDIYGSYSFDVVKDVSTIVPGFTAYTYPSAHRSDGFYNFTFEPNLAFNYTVGSLKLTPKIYYDVVLKGFTGEFNVAYTVPLTGMGTELDFAGTAGTFKWDTAVPDASPDVHNWGDYWLVGVSMPFAVTKESKLTLGVAYTKGSNNYFKQQGIAKAVNTAAEGRVVGTVSFAYTF